MIYVILMCFYSCPGYQSSKSVTRSPARDRRTTGMLCGGFPQHHQLLGEESRRNAAEWVSCHLNTSTRVNFLVC